MSNYYELLKIQPTVSIAEIESAYDEQYNQWRRLVTHHDPTVVEESNRALRTLEQIRATLTDPTKRAAYDAGIGIGGSIGGLADPAAVLKRAQMVSPMPPTLHQQVPVGQTQMPVNAWACPRCLTSNIVGTHFCKSCGQEIGRACPNCGQLIEAAVQYCTECGADIKAVEREKQAKEELERQRQSAYERENAERQSALSVVNKIAGRAWLFTKLGWIFVIAIAALEIAIHNGKVLDVIGFVGSPILWGFGFVIGLQSLSHSRIQGDDDSRGTARKALFWSLVGIVLLGISFIQIFGQNK
jgi:hypothetical protein